MIYDRLDTVVNGSNSISAEPELVTMHLNFDTHKTK